MAEASNPPTGTPAEFAALNKSVDELSRRLGVVENDDRERMSSLANKVANLDASDIEQNTRLNEQHARIDALPSADEYAALSDRIKAIEDSLK